MTLAYRMTKEDKYRALVLTGILLFAMWADRAHATNRQPEPEPPAQEQAQDQHQKQNQGQDQHQGQEQTATSDQDQRQSQEQDNDQSFNYSSKYERGAPAVTVWSSPSTASFMQCFGLGGSSKDGAATGAWCRIQRDLYALHLSDRFRSLHAFQLAAKVYCSRPLHYRPWGKGESAEAACGAEYAEILRTAPVPTPEQPGPSPVTVVVATQAEACERKPPGAKGFIVQGKEVVDLECYPTQEE